MIPLCSFDFSAVIISHVEHLFMCLKKKKAVLNLPLEIAFVEVLHVVNSFLITYPRTFLESRCAFSSVQSLSRVRLFATP